METMIRRVRCYGDRKAMHRVWAIVALIVVLNLLGDKTPRNTAAVEARFLENLRHRRNS